MKNPKKKLKNILLLVTVFFAISCSSDLYEEQIKKSNKSMKMLNRSEIANIPKLTLKLNQIKSTKNKVQEKIVTDTTYNFSVDTNSAIYISSETSETYTFNVIREDNDNKIENLILKANSDGTFRTFLIKYNFTDSDKEIEDFNPNNYKSLKFTEIETDYNQFINNRCIYRSDFICVDSYEYSRVETNGGSNVGGAPLWYYAWRVVATNCTFVTQSSGCGGSESNLINTFETSPIHSSGGYGGVSLTLTTKQQTFINALNITSSENFSMMNGDIQMNILNYIDTLTNGQIGTVVYFFNNTNTLWLTNQASQTQQGVFNYLIANNFSTQSSSFINLLTTYCQNNLNNEETIKYISANIIEKQINDTNLDPCGKSILNRLKNLQQNDISKIIIRLGDVNSVYTLNINSQIPITSNALAATVWQTDSQGNILPYNYIIKILPDYTLVATDLAIASTILHEMIHAYFLSLIDDCSQNNNNCNLSSTFPDLWNYYVTNYNSGIYTNLNVQHNILAANYVSVIGSALQEFITGSPVAVGQNPEQVYTDMAWYGLDGTTPYNNLSQADKDRINFRFDYVELLNQSAINPNGLTIVPKGTRTSPCN